MAAIAQLSFLPAGDHEPRVKRASVPVALLIDGRWCWKAFDRDEYIHEPDLETILLEALARRAQRKAA